MKEKNGRGNESVKPFWILVSICSRTQFYKQLRDRSDPILSEGAQNEPLLKAHLKYITKFKVYEAIPNYLKEAVL